MKSVYLSSPLFQHNLTKTLLLEKIVKATACVFQSAVISISFRQALSKTRHLIFPLTAQ